MEKIVLISHNALGDTLCMTCALRAYKEANPDHFVTLVTHSAGYTQILEGNPDIDLLIYSDHMLFHGLKNYSEEFLYSLPLDFSVPQQVRLMDMKLFCTTEAVFQEHISTGFTKYLGVPVIRTRPYVFLTESDRSAARSLVKDPYVVISLHSNSNPPREDGNGNKKDWPVESWARLCQLLLAKGIKDIVAIGSEYDQRYGSPVWRNLYGLPIRITAALLEQTACVVTLENGTGHLAHGVDAPTVMIYSDLMPLPWAAPNEASNVRVLYGDPHSFSPEAVCEEVEIVLSKAGACNTLIEM